MKTLKLSKTSQIFLSVGIFVVIAASLGWTRSKQLDEQNQLDEELSVVEKRVDNIQVKPLRQKYDELQGQLDASTTQLTAVKDNLRQPVESIDVTDEFFAIAYSCGVEVTSVSTSVIKSEKLGNITCAMIALNAGVTGEVPNLINFVTRLNDDFTTGIVKSAQISIPESSGVSKPSAGVTMSVYAYKGD
jgi:hypothetical protein